VAARNAQRHVELNPEDPRALYFGAVAWCRLGQTDRGLELGDQALALDPDDAGVLYNVACLNAVARRTERALQLLERAVQNGFGHREWIEHDPDFDSVRDEPRFQSLLQRL
jgi:adenylate cyclase